MKPELQALNDVLSAIQEYIDPQRDDLIKLTPSELEDFNRTDKQFIPVYEQAIDQFRDLWTQCSPEEIVEAYGEGCRLLQMMLSGYMCQNINDIYISKMMEVIRIPHPHTGWIFLQALAYQYGKNDVLDQQIRELVIDSLDIWGVRETALYIVEQLKLYKAIPVIQSLKATYHPDLLSIADDVLQTLK